MSQCKRKAEASEDKDVERYLKMLKSFFKLFATLGEKKSFTETRMRLYKQIKTKTSQSLLTEEKSMLQAIKCVHYQVCYSSRVHEITISDIFLQDNGWIVDKKNKEVRPLWFTGTFLISFLHFHSSQQI